MEQSRGRILSIHPDSASATVEVAAGSVCARCAQGKGCGAGVFGSDQGARRFDAPIVGNMVLHVGDEVQIELAPQSVLQAAALVYGVPLVVALVASGFALWMGASDGVSVLMVLAGIGGGVLVSRRQLQGAQCLRRFTPAC